MHCYRCDVNTYLLMWPKRAHLLKPLFDKFGEKSSCWTPDMDQAFKIMKNMLTVDVLMAYPNPNIPFHFYIDASNDQVGAIIIQQKRKTSYYVLVLQID